MKICGKVKRPERSIISFRFSGAPVASISSKATPFSSSSRFAAVQ